MGVTGEEVLGEVGEVTGGLRRGGDEGKEMAGTKTGLGCQAGQAAALAIGETMATAERIVLRRNCRDFQGGARVGDGRVHDFPRWGVHTPRAICMNVKRKGLQNLMDVSA